MGICVIRDGSIVQLCVNDGYLDDSCIEQVCHGTVLRREILLQRVDGNRG